MTPRPNKKGTLHASEERESEVAKDFCSRVVEIGGTARFPSFGDNKSRGGGSGDGIEAI